MTLHEASPEELQSEWERAEELWNGMTGKVDNPWVHARFVLEVFKVTLRQRGWKVPVMLGGPL